MKEVAVANPRARRELGWVAYTVSKPCSPSLGDPLDLRHDALVVLVALRVAVGAGVLLNNLLDVLAELHSTIFGHILKITF